MTRMSETVERAAWGVVLLVLPLCATAQTDAQPSRGRLLYDNHCIACHDTQVHWRDAKIVTDWASLKAQVRRWQAAAYLNWSDDDIDAVARHLNDAIYRMPPAARMVGAAPPPASRP